jgi:hypothetical protein
VIDVARRIISAARAGGALLRRLPTAAWLVVLVVVAILAVYLAGQGDGRRDVQRQADQAAAETRVRTADTLVASAGERAADGIATHQLERELINAASAYPDRPVSPAGLRLACERLRNDGVDLRRVAECRGPDDRGQAPP